MSARSARLALLFANAGHLATHFLMLLYPTVVLSLEGRFGLSYGELLSLSLPGFVLYGVAALPAGWLGDRWSAEWMMVAFFVGSGGGAVLTGLAGGPLGIAVGLGVIGAFGAIYHPVGLAWLVRNAENRGRILGYNGIFGSIGVGMAPVTAAALTDFAGWRAAFFVPGLLCLAVGVALAFFLRLRLLVPAGTDRVPTPDPGRAVVLRAFIVLSVTMTASGLVAQVIPVVLPKLFDLRLARLTDGGTLGAGGLVSLVFIVASTMQMLGGWLADRFALRRLYVLSWALQIPLLLALTRLVELPLLAASTLAYCLVLIATPVENTLVVLYTPGHWRATAFGAKFVLALGIGAGGVPLAGFLYDRTGDFVWLFAILTVLAAVVALGGLFLPREEVEAIAAPPRPAAAE